MARPRTGSRHRHLPDGPTTRRLRNRQCASQVWFAGEFVDERHGAASVQGGVWPVVVVNVQPIYQPLGPLAER